MPRTRSNPSGPNVGFYLVKAVAAAVEAAKNVEVLKNTKVNNHWPALKGHQGTHLYHQKHH
jgi:hypothetical protein